MKKIESSKFSIIPIIIVILCALGIYFIYYYKQKEYYNNFVEKFDNYDNLNENFVNQSSIEENKIIIENALNNVAFTRYLANGNWTTNQSTYKNNSVTNLMKINIDEELKGTVDLTSVSPGSIYNITSVLNMSLSGVHKTNKNQSIIIEFKNDFLTNILNKNKVTEGFVGERDIDSDNESDNEKENFENNGTDENEEDFKNKKNRWFWNRRRRSKRKMNSNSAMTYSFISEFLKGKVDPQKIEYYFKEIEENKIKFRNILRCKVSLYTNNTLNLEYYSYKIFDPNNTGGLLSRLIASQQYYNIDVPMKHNLYLYNKYLLKYKYPTDMVHATYNFAYNKTSEPTFTKTLETKYANQLYIAYQREFLTIDNQVVRTPLSKPYVINVIDKNGLYFNSIRIKSINSGEKKFNEIQKNFAVKNTVVYFYKMIQQKNTYTFKDNKNELKSQFNLKNSADSMFSKGNISFPNLFNTLNTNKSTYTLTLIKSYTTNDDNKIIIVPYRDLKLLV